MRVAFDDFIAVLALRCHSVDSVHPKSKWWTVAVQLTEVTSCRRVRLCCQFYKYNNYLTGDAAKD